MICNSNESCLSVLADRKKHFRPPWLSAWKIVRLIITSLALAEISWSITAWKLVTQTNQLSRNSFNYFLILGQKLSHKIHTESYLKKTRLHFNHFLHYRACTDTFSHMPSICDQIKMWELGFHCSFVAFCEDSVSDIALFISHYRAATKQVFSSHSSDLSPISYTESVFLLGLYLLRQKKGLLQSFKSSISKCFQIIC